MASRSKPAVNALIPSLGVSDIERSVGFYRAFFGFELEDSYETDGRMTWCWLKAGATNLMLQQLTSEQQIRLHPAIGQSWVMYIRPEDIQATHAKLQQAGFPVSDIVSTSYGARECFVSDPDGYELWLSVPRPPNGDDEDEDKWDQDEESEEEDEDDDEDEEQWQVRH